MLIQTGDVPEQQVTALSTLASKIINDILKRENVSADLNPNAMFDVSKFFLRDIYRLDAQQSGSVSIAKFAGYFGFWIRKLKPIENAFTGTQNGSSKPVVDVNELVALNVGIAIIEEFRRAGVFTDYVGEKCPYTNECNKTDCFLRFAKRYFDFEDGYHKEYIMYSMRHRTFGPHHFAILFEQLLFSSCKLSHGY